MNTKWAQQGPFTNICVYICNNNLRGHELKREKRDMRGAAEGGGNDVSRALMYQILKKIR